jgi:hypothetical protein
LGNVELPSRDWKVLERVQKRCDEEHNVYFVFKYSPVLLSDTGLGTVGSIRLDGSGKELANCNGGDSDQKRIHRVYFTRLSAQVYLELGDFLHLANLVKELIAEEMACT